MYAIRQLNVTRQLANVSFRNASTLVVAEHQGGKLGASTLNAIAASQKIGGDVTVLVAGKVISLNGDNVHVNISRIIHCAKIASYEQRFIIFDCLFDLIDSN